MENLAAVVYVAFIVVAFVVEIQSYPSTYLTHYPAPKLPHYLQPCHRRHKSFNLCVKTSLQKFFHSVVNGSAEVDFPPIEPLYVPEIIIKEGANDVYLDLNFHHVAITGFGLTKVVAVRSNMEDIIKLEITLKYPYLNFTGQYSGNGIVKTFPIVGEGPFFFNMSDVSAAWIIYLSESEDSPSHFSVDNFIMDISPVEIAAMFGNTIDGDSEAFNGFFNENAQEIFKVAKPKITEALSSIFSDLANKLLSIYPATVLIPS